MLESAHTINIWVHVVFGGLALLLGLVPLLTVKGGPRHRRIGGYFVACLSVVLVTATTGLLIFSFRAFLAVITMLSAYHAYSGLRALKNKAAGPTLQDGVVSCVGLAAALLFLVYIHSVKVPWVPVVIYSTLGALIAVTVYDLARFSFPRRWTARVWFYEHLVKMIGAYTAVVSAFSGTVLEAWQPYSQILPSALGMTAMVGFTLYFNLKRRSVAALEPGLRVTAG